MSAASIVGPFEEYKALLRGDISSAEYVRRMKIDVDARLAPVGRHWLAPLPNSAPKSMGFARYTFVLGILVGFAIYRIVEALT